MNKSTEHRRAVAIRDAIDTVEEAYEFMLAYAAQGRKQEGQEEGTSKIRDYLNRFAAALESMEKAVPDALGGTAAAPFRQRLLADMAVMRSVIAILLEKPSISSDMVDNTNGLIAVRSFLTDLFFVDQAMLPPR